MKSAFLEKLISHLDRLDKGSLQAQFMRLAQQKGLLDAIFEAIREGLVVLDREGGIQYANRMAHEMLGMRDDTVEGVPISRYLKGLEWDLLRDLDEGEWQKMLRREIEITYPDHRYVEFYVVPLAAVSEEEEGAVVMLRDVTSDRETTAQSIESERLKAITLLAAGVAHEIGNPLNSLNIHLQLMERELRYVEDEETRTNMTDMLNIATQEVERLDSIINQFLRAIRPSEPVRNPVQLERLVEETLTFMKHEIQDRGILVETEWGDSLPAVSVDETQVKQAFFNLLKNALEILPSDGIIKISVEFTDRFAQVCFEDNGPGISVENMGTIGEPYKTTKASGSGLGLMIVQRIIRDHGGEMEILTEPGRGASFVLFFPRDDVRVRMLEAPAEEVANG
ncbi:nitrogen regulation protein NR(II) [Verrucomicrobiota bacterium]